VLRPSPLDADLWLLPPLGVGIVFMTLAPLLARRVHPGLVIGAGLAMAAAGYT
jgi:DHA2 family multidrug resistance protein-like MFS transporter